MSMSAPVTATSLRRLVRADPLMESLVPARQKTFVNPPCYCLRRDFALRWTPSDWSCSRPTKTKGFQPRIRLYEISHRDGTPARKRSCLAVARPLSLISDQRCRDEPRSRVVRAPIPRAKAGCRRAMRPWITGATIAAASVLLALTPDWVVRSPGEPARTVAGSNA